MKLVMAAITPHRPEEGHIPLISAGAYGTTAMKGTGCGRQQDLMTVRRSAHHPVPFSSPVKSEIAVSGPLVDRMMEFLTPILRTGWTDHAVTIFPTTKNSAGPVTGNIDADAFQEILDA